MNTPGVEAVLDLRTEVHEGAKRIRKKIRDSFEEWFRVCDHILDVYRARFLMREPTAGELEEHRVAVGECIATCEGMAAQLDGGSDEERELLSRLEVRIRQLKDAYDTFHDPAFSELMPKEC